MHPYSYFWGCGYFWASWVSFVTTDEFLVRVTKFTQGLVSYELKVYLSIFNLVLTQWLSKGYKPYNFEPHNSLKLSFTNIWGLRSNFVECESIVESLWDNLEWLNWFWQFLSEKLSSFNPKRFYCSYAWSCSLCERRTSLCMGLISRKLTYVFNWLYFTHCLSSFSSINHLLRLCAQYFTLFHLT